MKLTAEKIKYSSVVGQSIMVKTEAGENVCQLAIINPYPNRKGKIGHNDHRKEVEEIADMLISKINGAA